MFWLICLLLALCVASVLALPLLRPDAEVAEAPDVDIYRAQLAEVDRDVERGTLDEGEAERARTEIARRLLAASRARSVSGTAPTGWSRAAAAVVLLLVAGGAGWLYASIGAPGEPGQPIALRLEQADEMRRTRPDQAAFEAQAPELPAIEADPDYIAQIEQLRAIVPTRPDDLQGWELLAMHETRLGNFAAAARAQERIVALRGDAVGTVELERLADLLVIAADGMVSPEAEEVARQVLDRDPGNGTATYILGALYFQTGRPDVAFRAWRAMAEGGAQSFHAQMARQQIELAAARAGIDYSLPELSGPSAEDMAAAQDMAPEDRTAMIQGMVGQLAERLATQGGPPSEWARLIGAYGVLGETSKAAAIWGEAQLVFDGDAAAMATVRAAAERAGVVE